MVNIIGRFRDALGSDAFKFLTVSVPTLLAFVASAGQGGADLPGQFKFMVGRFIRWNTESVFAGPGKLEDKVEAAIRNIAGAPGVSMGGGLLFFGVLIKAFAGDMSLPGVGGVSSIATLLMVLGGGVAVASAAGSLLHQSTGGLGTTQPRASFAAPPMVQPVGITEVPI